MSAKKPQFIIVSEKNQSRLIDVLKYSIQRRKSYFLKQLLFRLHSNDLASLWNFFEQEEKEILLSVLELDESADLLSELEVGQRSEILKTKSTDWIIDRLEELETDDIVDILKELPDRKANFIIHKFDKNYSEKIRKLIHYPEETAGSLMSSNFFAVNESASVGSIIKKFREIEEKEEIENLQFVYVVDKKDKLLGYISIRSLILEKPTKKANKIMSPPPVIITPFMDQEEVAKIFKDINLISAAVIDEQGVLLGRITIDDIVDVLEEEASEDAFKMVGLGIEKSVANSVLISLKSRLPWLLVTLVATSLSALVIKYYEKTLEEFISLTAFMPMVAAMAGSISNQMVTMIVRGFAIGELHWRQIKSFLIRELGSVFIGSIIVGIILAIFTYHLNEEYNFVFVVSFAFIVIMLVSTIIGVSIPLILKLFRLDPATGSSMLTTTITDTVGFIIFLGLATFFLSR